MNPITSEKNKLGFVGVGYMGRPIVQRLLKSGFKVAAYDRDRSKAEELIRYGSTVAESVAKLSSSCDVVLSCLPSDEAVLHVYRGADGAFANALRGALVIDMSTVNPETSLELSKLGSERGVDVLDVTISGSTPAAEQGALTLFGGGKQDCFDAAESIFRVMARKYFYLGPSGSGATMKLSAHFTAIGALSGATLGWFDPQRKMYRKIPINGQHEVIGMSGDIALYQGKPVVHTHMVVGTSDGTTRAGHVLDAYVSPTLEVMVTVDPVAMQKRFDPETDLTLIDPALK
jgi:predicted DNA-binding protein with PD1-like motif